MTSKVQSTVIKQLKRKGYLTVSVMKLSANGFPDVLGMKKDYPDVWVECKEENDTLKELQKHRINQLNDMGKVAFCYQEGKGIIYPENLEFNFK